jgi:hypothetical protein
MPHHSKVFVDGVLGVVIVIHSRFLNSFMSSDLIRSPRVVGKGEEPQAQPFIPQWFCVDPWPTQERTKVKVRTQKHETKGEILDLGLGLGIVTLTYESGALEPLTRSTHHISSHLIPQRLRIGRWPAQITSKVTRQTQQIIDLGLEIRAGGALIGRSASPRQWWGRWTTCLENDQLHERKLFW